MLTDKYFCDEFCLFVEGFHLILWFPVTKCFFSILLVLSGSDSGGGQHTYNRNKFCTAVNINIQITYVNYIHHVIFHLPFSSVIVWLLLSQSPTFHKTLNQSAFWQPPVTKVLCAVRIRVKRATVKAFPVEPKWEPRRNKCCCDSCQSKHTKKAVQGGVAFI